MAAARYICCLLCIVILVVCCSVCALADDNERVLYDDEKYPSEIRLRDGTEFYFTLQPEDQNGVLGNTVTFSCAVNNPNAVPQWQYHDGTSWVNSPLPSANTWNLEVPVTLNRDGVWYRCKVRATGYPNIVSKSAVLYVTGLSLSACLSYVGQNIISHIFNFVTPWGITFGAIVVGIFGAPLIVKAYKKFF